MQSSLPQRPAHHQRAATLPAATRPAAAANNGGESDSWIEIPSHPSDTSSSDEHIITSGLRINRRKRRSTNSFHGGPTPANRHHPAHCDTSEDEEGAVPMSDFSDDDNDRPEDVASFIATQLSSSGFTTSSASTDDEDSGSDGEDGRTVFESPRNRVPHPSTAEHDAALRASLSTLLSCAAAARGLPKKPEHATASRGRVTGGPVEGLRVMREGDLPTSSKASVDEPATSAKRRDSTTSPSASSEALQKKKSQPTPGKRRNSSAAARVKKIREMSTLNASLLTLAFSAGAVVVLTAISFSAGYWVGREAGRGETGLLERWGAGQGGRAVRRVGRVAG